jgi:hypothetical protein
VAPSQLSVLARQRAQFQRRLRIGVVDNARRWRSGPGRWRWRLWRRLRRCGELGLRSAQRSGGSGGGSLRGGSGGVGGGNLPPQRSDDTQQRLKRESRSQNPASRFEMQYETAKPRTSAPSDGSFCAPCAGGPPRCGGAPAQRAPRESIALR